MTFNGGVETEKNKQARKTLSKPADVRIGDLLDAMHGRAYC